VDNQIERELLASVREMVKWIRVQSRPAARAAVEAALTESAHRRLYQSLDGTRSQKQLAELVGASQPTVSRLINSWVRAGLVDEVSSGRFVKAFDLNTLGIDLAPKGRSADVD
jgi:hypothetical protein